jgi:hypothetical protein
MSLWFEIAVLVVLGVIAVCLIDMCFGLESLTRNLANLGTRLETEVLPRLEVAIRGKEK